MKNTLSMLSFKHSVFCAFPTIYNNILPLDILFAHNSSRGKSVLFHVWIPFSLPYTNIHLSVYRWRTNVESLENISTDNLVSGSLMSKTKFLPPQKLLKLRHRLATNVCYIFWHHWAFSQSVSAFFRVEPLLLWPHQSKTD